MECSVSFLWTNESFSLWNCLSKNSTTDLWLVFKQPRQRGFGRNLRYILYSMVKESTFLKGNFCSCKSFMDVFCILTSAWMKKHKMCIWNWFFAMCSSRGGGGGGTRPIFEYGWAAQGLKPWPCLGQKNPKIHTLSRKTSSILVPCLGQLPQFYY